MSAGVTSSYRNFDLPWNAGSDQERRFLRILQVALGITLLLALVVPWLPVATPEPVLFVEVPVEMLDLPQVPPEEEKPEPEPEPKPVPPPPKVPPKPVPPTRTPVPVKAKPAPPQPSAREKAAQALGSLADDLASLRDNTTADQVAAADATINAAPSEATKTERALITSMVGKSSGGISSKSVTKGGTVASVGTHSTAQVSDPTAGMKNQNTSGFSSGGSRSREEVELVFDRNKGALYALYSRALRQNPSLQGKLVLQLTIQPNGVVSQCSVISSELGDPQLEQRIVQRVKLFRFEAKDVLPVQTSKPIDFFPAG